jgi:hypothetical protein
MTNSTETQVLKTRDIVSLGDVFRDSDDEIMNVAALLNYLKNLKCAGKSINIVPFALAEAEVLHEGGNETIDLNYFAHEVGQRVLSTLE